MTRNNFMYDGTFNGNMLVVGKKYIAEKLRLSKG